MPGFDIVKTLNSRFACTQCGAVGSWLQIVKPSVRQNSSICRLRCAQCCAQIVAKVSQGRKLSVGNGLALRGEYETLRALQPAFSSCVQYGTLEPLGFLVIPDGGVMITRMFHGEELEHHASKQDDMSLRETFRSAGVWLRKLHEASGDRGARSGLDVGKRRDYLRATYGATIDADRKVRFAYELLDRVGRDVDSFVTQAVRLHGDFKPGNLLCNSRRYVGLDIQWKSTSAGVYDLASFVNHLWIAPLGGIGSRARRRHELAEAAFLAGFGGMVDMRALRWTQLYFALCYWGGYRHRGGVAAAMARWKMLPLVEMASARLNDAI